ncbi:HupE/UreJ family protein [Rhodoblastus acidophilus]|uniref:HupE/UreJ family protein n=1 Tax=Candidatus Rhodoblastus alkanivorans TaxID=2954117 RepID=A0ABS9Z2A7_9HYPH|nr:HupE/UreJ family protein [Candidatus Rhodoblastus alkanivorans]MCI4677446.1 HupE/UreJ family protein [Candidatus Rhodoblastus alkanivorans]MCI4681805.1 HupE/UreJ family protein [Candidatus Rhodoblastus alkanivorans]MDI4642855.1 HupE/UreJ family protein [Rhodoblastus acidophilus]
MKRFWQTAAAAAALVAIPVAASAHPGLHATGFEDGFIHPFTGADHLMAMTAVGYWAGQFGGRMRFVIPAVFVGVMALGAALGFHSEAPGFIEYGIAASVAIMGALIAFDVKMPAPAAAGLVGLFAFFHGFAHGAEAPAAATQVLFFSGFVAASLILQGAGLALASLRPGRTLSRVAGALVAVGGVWMLSGA